MKKWGWIAAVVVVAVLIGGYAYSSHQAMAQAYQTSMTNGREAVAAKNYTEAETHFQDALKRKQNDATAQRYLTQTQRFVSAQSAMDTRSFGSAQNNYQKVADTQNGIKDLKNRAASALKTVKLVRQNVAQFTKVLDRATVANQAQNYGGSNATLDELFNNPTFKEPYYQDLYTKANALRAANNGSIAYSDKSTTSGGTTASSSSASTASSNSASLTESEQQAAKNYKGTNEYTVTKKQKELNGKEITAAQIAAARKTIDAAGGDASAMSDQDVRVAMQQAAAKHESLSQYAKETLR